ncbi:hypothetical protein [Amaricoccus sp. B4]|uniref:hypothetical protein n=1 Tax=Amaricoccus sp. B4 TaxID=3368557 RepID=UPI003710F8C7
MFVHLSMMLLTASTGLSPFHVQHQIEETSWHRDADWSVRDAALHGALRRDRASGLGWITANIGGHHAITLPAEFHSTVRRRFYAMKKSSPRPGG